MVYLVEVVFMAYFLKKAKQQKHTYLAIYESFYSPDVKGTKHRCFKSLGSVERLKDSGMEDPISFYQNEVNRLNMEKNVSKADNKIKQIASASPIRHLGYFPLCNIFNTLDVAEHFGYMQSTRSFQFNVFAIFSSLVYARVVAPNSKHKTFYDVLPCLFNKIDYSYDQLLEAVEFVGCEYEKFVEIFTVATKENYGIDTKHTFFDCTNFYFEIDKESHFQKKGPSKEHRADPIVGLGLLLDANMIPIGMRMYPGNESEKPVIRNIIGDLKKQNNIQGRTVQIADKGLNCARNILEALTNNDGYLFSKSIKQLPKKEKEWVLLDNDYQEIYDENNKLKYRYKSCVDKFAYSYIDENGRKVTRTVTEKRLCTYNPKLAKKKMVEIDKMVNKARNLCLYEAKKEEYGESAKYVNFTSEDGKKAKVSINEEIINKDLELAGYNLLITSEIKMKDTDIYDAYHNLWRIEESFRVMKSELDARPVYLQKEDSIKGHFLICYVAILLTRILQFKVLNNRYSSSTIFNFIRTFNIVMINDNKFINLAKASDFIKDISITLNHPITNYYLTSKQIKMMHTR